MAKGLWLVLAGLVAYAAAQQDKYTDENRPYKFGFNIQGHQHRKEEKDENGIIKGEYGFITADGYYRITVYATDENGSFHIISMKNIYVGFPPDDPTTTPAPTTRQGERLNLKFGTAAPRINSETRAPSVLTTSTSTTTTTPTPILTNGLTTPFGKGKAACSGCFLPPTTTKKPQDYKQPTGLPPTLINSRQPVQLEPGSRFGNQKPNSQLAGQQPGSPFAKQQPGNPGGSKPQNQGNSYNGQNPNNTPNSFNPSKSGNSSPQNQNFQGINGAKGPLNNLGDKVGNFNPGDINNGFGPNKEPGRKDDDQVVLKRVNTGNKLNENDPSLRKTINPQIPGEVKDGLPLGVSEDDIQELLYRFNYTVGFHGHHEDGYVNGNKKGDYFFDGRDGKERRVEYIANEFGYQPNITLIQLNENDVRIPKEETEKDFGLKGYEFKWFRNP